MIEALDVQGQRLRLARNADSHQHDIDGLISGFSTPADRPRAQRATALGAAQRPDDSAGGRRINPEKPRVSPPP